MALSPTARDAFGGTLRRARTCAGLTQRELAMHCGMSQSHLSTIETGRTLPSVGHLVRLAASLHVAWTVEPTGEVVWDAR